MGCGAAEVAGLGFVCFVVINPRVLTANKVGFLFHKFSNLPSPLPSLEQPQLMRLKSHNPLPGPSLSKRLCGGS